MSGTNRKGTGSDERKCRKIGMSIFEKKKARQQDSMEVNEKFKEIEAAN
jgi:ribosomal protein L13E